MRLTAQLLLAIALASAVLAQEPKPATVLPTWFADPEGTRLDLAWRYAPGDDPRRAQPGYDDSNWASVRPAMMEDQRPPGGWPGVGWFRRHLEVDPEIRGRRVAMQLRAPGAADVYLDGELVWSSRGAPASREQWTLIALAGPRHVLAVRYSHPRDALPSDEIGFRLTIADASAESRESGLLTRVALRGAIVALPVFLMLLHLALYAFDSRGRENLFYSVEMAAFAVIAIHDYRIVLAPVQAAFVTRINDGAPIVAILFALLTYYAVRARSMPRSWRVLAALGAVLFVASYVVPDSADQYLWVAYFVAMMAEVVRVERSGQTIEPSGWRFAVAAFELVAASIVAQILVNFGVLSPIAGIREVYIFGILASAVGMSLFLAHTLGYRRIAEMENARKSEEMEQARALQLSLLPRELPRIDGLDIAVATRPATEVGGDYYDVRHADDGSLTIALGDATGHGLAAGVVVTAAKALFVSLPDDEPVSARLERCDRALRAMQLPALRMCMTIAQVSHDEFVFASAAMPPVLVYRQARGVVEELGRGSLPLGGRLRSRYEECRATLATGDVILMASDGFAEQCGGDDGAQLGYEAVAVALASAAAGGSATAVLEQLLEVASRHRGARAQDDDMTFVVLRVTS